MKPNVSGRFRKAVASSYAFSRLTCWRIPIELCGDPTCQVCQPKSRWRTDWSGSPDVFHDVARR